MLNLSFRDNREAVEEGREKKAKGREERKVIIGKVEEPIV
jgi:hypothetical protein